MEVSQQTWTRQDVQGEQRQQFDIIDLLSSYLVFKTIWFFFMDVDVSLVVCGPFQRLCSVTTDDAALSDCHLTPTFPSLSKESKKTPTPFHWSAAPYTGPSRPCSAVNHTACRTKESQERKTGRNVGSVAFIVLRFCWINSPAMEEFQVMLSGHVKRSSISL